MYHDRQLGAGPANVMSVDVEDWFQVGAFERVIDKADWPRLQHRVEANTDAVLALFAETGVKATFFTLGWVAHHYPALIRRIAEAGHEVASHGWDHDRVFTFTPDQFRDDLARARAALEDAGGQAVTGYRAPSFSFDARTPWAHRVLAEAGYGYSSSIAPLTHDHYGWPDAPRRPFRPLADSPLIEMPVTVATVLGREVTAGGGFFRLLPSSVVEKAIVRSNAAGDAAIFYFHPWEIDPGQPRVQSAPLKSRIRHYSRLGAMAGKLRRLTANHGWGRADSIAARAAATLA
ncbi:XrtA system polysaccharide deacetylase [Sphingomonas sp. Y38-1Y]|uniref:XrtA system polysaccharide deacetylase n=1 Tax=Sphingomonas sp. Y38-1Y TaxID=3078265 RepID=UPI0028EE374F|nr:XrtA system polysaccharide deacetylase [Sphingomonas sp. Y38-1Y]